jgi:Endoplasmic reticulum-based factor for assembly of V-ATPase
MTAFHKRLLGVALTPELEKLYKEAIDPSKSNGDACKASAESPAAEEASREATITADNALAVLEQEDCASTASLKEDPYLTIRALQALAVTSSAKDRLDEVLQSSRVRLVYSAPPVPSQEATLQRKRFQDRLTKLKYKQEEYRYTKLTKNLGLTVQKDDVTTRSMTYAASVGLNMIIAPISFGVFMYFFAGGILEYIWPRVETASSRHVQGPDIRKVIAGVVSGVLMLFIEMILFVIRTHEMEHAMLKKQKRSKDGPFGHYTADTVRTYKED